MKTSELIKSLQETLDKNGDKEIMMRCLSGNTDKQPYYNFFDINDKHERMDENTIRDFTWSNLCLINVKKHYWRK